MSTEHHKAVHDAVNVLAATFNAKVDAMLLEAYSIGLRSLTPAEIEQATAVAMQQCKFMPKPCELIEFARTCGVSYETQAVVAWEELDKALSAEKPSMMSPLVAAIARQLGGFQLLLEISQTDFYTWKRKEFLAAHVVLSKENPERLAAITGPRSDLVKALKLKLIETREQLKLREEANRRKLLEVFKSDRKATSDAP